MTKNTSQQEFVEIKDKQKVLKQLCLLSKSPKINWSRVSLLYSGRQKKSWNFYNFLDSLSINFQDLCKQSFFISSPEHEVLKWAFVILQCPSSVVRPCDRASVRPSTISLNNISSETTYWILTKLHRNDPWVVLYQNCSNRSSWLHK